MSAACTVLAERPVTLPRGFRAAAAAAGLKQTGKPDLALVAADEAVPCAGVFTQSVIRAAPVKYCEARLRSGQARAVFTNAGIANASTGQAGMRDTEVLAGAVGDALGCPADDVLVCSTGVIAKRLNTDQVRAKVADLVAGLRPDGFDAAATAIHTTDTVRKDVAVRFAVDGREMYLAGMCKGAAMIAPNMATMLAYLFTDAAAEPAALRVALRAGVADTFNCITIDSDTSTNDTVLLFANGAAGNRPIREGAAGFDELKDAVHTACASLARQIVLDAEGASKLIEVHVVGAASVDDARRIGLSIANSPLVKTAVFGADPNYGRLVMAVGKAGVPVAEEDLCIRCGDVEMLRNGELVAFDVAAAQAYLQNPEVAFHVAVGRGPGAARILTSDLTYEYVRLNAEYTT